MSERVRNVVYIHKGTLFGHEKYRIFTSATTWMELEDVMLSEVSQKARKLIT
jgi:hypothetical protein